MLDVAVLSNLVNSYSKRELKFEREFKSTWIQVFKFYLYPRIQNLFESKYSINLFESKYSINLFESKNSNLLHEFRRQVQQGKSGVLESVVRRPDSAIHWIAMFSTFFNVKLAVDRYNLRLRFGIYKLKFLRSIVGSRSVVSQLLAIVLRRLHYSLSGG